MKKERPMKNLFKRTLTGILTATMVIAGAAPALTSDGAYETAQATDSGDGIVTYRAVLIGNTYPDSANELYGPEYDIDNMEGFLESLDVPYTVTALDDASKSQAKSAISTAFADADADDVSLFFYSGHGNVASSSSVKDGALCMYDSSSPSGIELMTLSEVESCLSAVSGKVVVILDSCGSGAGVVSDPYTKSNSLFSSKSSETITSEEEAEAFTQSAYDVFSENDTTVTGSSSLSSSKYAEFCSSKYYVIAGCEVGTYSYTTYWYTATNQQASDEEINPIYVSGYGSTFYAAGALTLGVVRGGGYNFTASGGSRTSTAKPADTDSSETLSLYETYVYAQDQVTNNIGVPQGLKIYPESSSQIIFDDTGSVTVTFDANGGSGSMESKVTASGASYTLPSCTYTAPTGYHFAGWDINGTTYAAGASYTVTGDTTVKALWEVNTYTVSFNANGGSGSMSAQSFTYDVAKALTANAFTRSGYTFSGWNTASDGTGTAYTDGQSVSNLTSDENGSVTLYAQWTAVTKFTASSGNTYTVTGSNTVAFTGNIPSSKKITIPSTIIANGITYKVTAIAAKAFAGNKKITSVTAGKYIKTVGGSAFKNCTKLKTVDFSTCAVKKIGKNAFSGCKNLKTLSLNVNKLKTVGSKALKSVPSTCRVKIKASTYKKFTAAVTKLKKAGGKKLKYSKRK